MPKQKHQKIHLGEKVLAEWKAPEFRNLKKLNQYKLGSLILGVLLLAWAVCNSNFLFAFILILGVFLIYFISDYRPKNYSFMITDTGVWVDSEVFRFIEIDRFWIAPYLTKKDKFFIFHSSKQKETRVPVPIDRAEEIRQIVNDYVPQAEHKLSLFDLIEQAFL